MDLAVNLKDLMEALRTIGPAATGRVGTTSGMVRISTSERLMYIEAHRGDLAIRTSVRASISADGELVVSLRALDHAVAGEDGESFRMRSADGLLVVSGDHATSELRMAGIQWPVGPTPPSGQTVTWTQDQVGAVASVAYAAATNRGNVLSGVFVSGARASATDTYRSAWAKLPVSLPDSAILPADVLELVANSTVDGVEIDLGPRSVGFRSGSTEWRTSVVLGTHPDLGPLFAADNPDWISVGRLALKHSLDHVSFFADVVDLSSEGGELHLEGSGDDGTGSDTIACRTSQPLSIRMRAQYLSDALARVESDEVRLELPESGSYLVIRDDQVEHQIALHTVRYGSSSR